MKLIIGLGNPGLKYEKTRHNLGFLVIDQLLEDLNISMNNKKFNGVFASTIISGEKIIIAKPMTYMNNSGSFILELMNYYKIDIQDILVVVDDKDREINKYKLVQNSGSGGQNGIENIISLLGTKKFARLKCGVGIPKKTENTSLYVLNPFNSKQKEIINKMIPHYVQIIKDFVKLDFIDLLNKYNGGIS